MTARATAALALSLALTACAANRLTDAPIQLWRMDCGLFDIADLEGRGPLAMPVSCYLVRDGDAYIVFDAGLATALKGAPEKQGGQTISLDRTLAEQFAEIGVDPARVGTLVVSHHHGDHHGQASLFPNATLVIGAGDLGAYRGSRDAGELAPWLDGRGG